MDHLTKAWLGNPKSKIQHAQQLFLNPKKLADKITHIKGKASNQIIETTKKI